MLKLLSKKTIKNLRIVVGKIADIGGIIGLIFLVFDVMPTLRSTESTVNNNQEQLAELAQAMNSKDPYDTLFLFHYYIEQEKYLDAWSLFTETKQKQQDGGYEKFVEWHSKIVKFQGLKITSLASEDGASSKAFFVEYDLHLRGLKPQDKAFGYTMIFDGDAWKINHSTYELRENNVRDKINACAFFSGFDICE